MRATRLVVLVLAATAALATAPAQAQDPPFVDWPSLLPGLPGKYAPSVWDACADGAPTCVDRTLWRMYGRLGKLLRTCDHNAVFQLTYIRVTESYRKAFRNDTHYFDEPAFLAHEDAVFAKLYFDAYDGWKSGGLDRVPAAWRIAFDAARDHSVSGIGDVLLGINAHVNRDMPLMLAGLGLIKPDGRSRRPDHNRFNRLLNNVYGEVIPEVAQRFDPTAAEALIPGTLLDDTVTFQILPMWREGVWRHAEALVNARNDAARALVAREIEIYAETQANMIKLLTGYPGVGGASTAARDAWCAAHGKEIPAGQPTGPPRAKRR